jgi:hypothetical protein
LKLSDKDVRLIKETLEYYGRTKDKKYVEKLAQKAQTFLDLEPPQENAYQFLSKLMQDYNHLAMQENDKL